MGMRKGILSGTGRNPELRQQKSPLGIFYSLRVKRDLFFLATATKILLQLKESWQAHFTPKSRPP